MGWGFTLLTWARSQLLPFWVALARAPLPESHSWSVKQRYAHVGWAAGSQWPMRQRYRRSRPELTGSGTQPGGRWEKV